MELGLSESTGQTEVQISVKPDTSNTQCNERRHLCQQAQLVGRLLLHAWVN